MSKKNPPIGFHLSDWKWGVVNPCEDYARLAEMFVVDPTSWTGLRYRNTDAVRKSKRGQPAGFVDVCRAGTQTGGGNRRAKDYSRIRVAVPKCTDAWASKRAQGNARQANVAAVIWLLTTGNWPPPSLIVDHINVDATDNEVSNIRLLTHGQNVKNTVRKTSSERRNKVLRKLDHIAEVVTVENSSI